MGLGRHKFQRAFSTFSDTKRDEDIILSGILGLPTGIGQNTVEVESRTGFVYVRLRDNLNEVIQAYNDQVSPVYGLPVLITRDSVNKNYYRIVRRDVGRYDDWGSISPYLAKHGNQHRFKPEIGGGGDVVFVEGRQFVPLMLTPSGSSGSGNVIMEGSHFYTGGTWKWAGTTGTPDLLAYRPTNNKSTVILVYIDGADNNPKLIAGDEFDVSISGTAHIIPFLPPVPTSEDVPLGAIQLYSGTQRIAWEQIYDLRPYIVGSAFIPTGTYGHTIRDDGMDMSQRSHLNFIGENVWINDDPGNDETEVIISGSAGGGGDTRRVIKDEGVAEADRDNLNFIGNGVFINDDVGNNELEIIISGSSDKYGIRDGGAPQTPRNWLNFIGDGVIVNDDPANDEIEIIITGSTGGAAGNPAGINTYIQYNNSGSFGADSGLTWKWNDDFVHIYHILKADGQIQVFDGSQVLPSYTFVSDHNTGMYLDSFQVLGFVAGNHQVIRASTSEVDILKDLDMNNNDIINVKDLSVSGTSNLNGAGGVFVRGGDLTVETQLDMDENSIINIERLILDTTPATTGTSAGTIYWNDTEYTINIITGQGPVLQVGHEIYTLVYNNTGVQIDNGTAVYPVGAVGIYPSVAEADATYFNTVDKVVFMTTMDILDGQVGLTATFGKIHDIDTSGFNLGDTIYVAPDGTAVVNNLTNVRPEFPDYEIQLGGIVKVDAVDGIIELAIRDDLYNTVDNFWNGAIRESFDFRTVSTGGIVSGTLTAPTGTLTRDLTMMFSDGFTLLDTSPGASIVLTPGLDDTPQVNYIYIPRSTKVLTKSTSDWPTTEHIRIAEVLLQSAATTATDGALRNQNWNDHLASTISQQGHLSHIGARIRALSSEWHSGVAGTLSGAPSDVYISTTAGKVFQMHLQIFPAQDMSAGDKINVVNDSVSPYRSTANLNDITDDADGDTLNNRWFTLVIWGVANKSGETSHLMCNLPNGSYTSESNAISDAFGRAVYTIPDAFKGVGFLIGAFTLRKSGATFTYNGGDAYQDLRGFVPNSTAGTGAGGSGITEFTTLTDTPSSYISEAKNVTVVNAGETALEFSSLLGLVDLTNPDTDRIYFWDDSESKSNWLVPDQHLSISGTSLYVLDDFLLNTGDTMEGSFIIDNTDTEAFLVRLDGDGGNVFIIDTTNVEIELHALTEIHQVADSAGLIIYGYDDVSASTVELSIDSAGDTQLTATGNIIVNPTNSVIIDNTAIEALLIRKNGDGGDVFIVDTTNSLVKASGDLRLGDGSAKDISLVFDDGIDRKLYWDDNEGTLRTDQPFVADGGLLAGATATGDDFIKFVYTPINDTAANLMNFSFYPTCTDDLLISQRGMNVLMQPTISAGKANTGKLWAMHLSSLDRGDMEGDLTEMKAVNVLAGKYNDGGGGTITDVYGHAIKMYYQVGTVTNGYGFYINAPSTGGTVTNEWAMYIADNALSYFVGDISAQNVTDRTPYYDGNALEEIKKIKSENEKIDHDTLPDFVTVKRKRKVALKKIIVPDDDGGTLVEKGETIHQGAEQLKKGVDYEEIEVKERNLGAMISVLTSAVQQLISRVEEIEKASLK